MRNRSTPEEDWHARAICPVCNWHAPAPDGTIASAPLRCRQCGAELTHRWRIATMRWVSRAVRFRPWTWASGSWEVARD